MSFSFPMKEYEPRPKSLSTFFCEIITSKYNQDIAFLLVGPKGSGKSYSALSIAYHTAVKIAKKMGGTWEDYFSMDNVAVVDPIRAAEILGNAKKYSVLLFDDIGLGWNSRTFYSEENITKNDIFQINRVENTVQILTAPSQFLIDKVPRSLCSHYAEIDQEHFRSGFVTLKFFKNVELQRDNKRIQTYLSVDKSRWIQYIIPKPPKALCDEYDAMRNKITKEIILARKDKLKNKVEAAEESQQIGRKRNPEYTKKVEEVDKLIAGGMKVLTACEKVGIRAATYNNRKRSDAIDRSVS